MTTLEKFQEVAKINFVESNGDVEIGTLMTQDGYDVHYIAADWRDLNFESEINVRRLRQRHIDPKIALG